MPTGPRVLLKNVCYHIITRGNQKQQLFFDDEDYGKYLSTLRRYKKRCDFLLYGYCLMPNHIHLLGEPKEPKDLSRFMQGVCRSYTASFNKRYKKVGHLWQGRFISKAIAKDDYFIDCIHYIERNPMRASLVKSASDYPWSSCKERTLAANARGRLLDDMRL